MKPTDALPPWVSRWLGIAAVVGAFLASFAGELGWAGDEDTAAVDSAAVAALRGQLVDLERRVCDLEGLTVVECYAEAGQ